ncbi:lipid II flippase family protein [Acinetobacter indicus]|uniref:DUF2837 family protein n=1 Tax=Acinetobacter indicus TaxID=756892 RepID=A0AAW8YYI6_9GAMM|nr:DUF2837 family protein [Acinetobacter indicus]MDV4314274.1 DUF2837 family protein [Acinetobacter indicus]
MNFNYLILSVIFCFGCIQLIEVLSYMARISGVIENKRSLAYSLQNAIFMLTRFFTMALLPMLGYLIDIGLDKNNYLEMVCGALFFSTVLTVLSYNYKHTIVLIFSKVIKKVSLGSNVLKEILMIPYYLLNRDTDKLSISVKLHRGIFINSALVFGIYSLSVFMVFFIALFFPDHRTMISQLSGVTNAFATVLLTFFIEPKISRVIDNNVDKNVGVSMLFSLVLGRIIGIGFLGFLLLFIIFNI